MLERKDRRAEAKPRRGKVGSLYTRTGSFPKFL